MIVGRKSPPRSRLKRTVFRLLAVLLPLALLALVEGMFVVFDAGEDLSLVTKVPGNPQILRYQFNANAERPYFERHELAGPEPRRFELPPPDGTYRILVVGASTVAGFPYPSALAFPRQLEVLLNQQQAGRKFEVLNAGITAINSFAVLDIIKQGVAAQPDLIIVHSGHNEFYGPGGAGSTVVVAPPALFPLAVNLRRARTYQLVSDMLRSEVPVQKHLQESLPLSVEIPLGGTRFRSAEQHYRHNLTMMVKAARAAGIPILLTSVASNLRDHSPVSFLVPTELDAARLEAWTAVFNEGQQLAAQEQWQEAIKKLELAEGLSRDSSLLHYRMGQCLDGLGRYDEARERFMLARDYDGCRFRAPSSFRAIIGEVAAQHAGSDLFMIDIEDALANEVGPEPVGSNLFLEHVHYNLDGHRLVARTLGRFVMTEVLDREWDRTAEPDDAAFDALLGLLQEDRISGESYALQVLDIFPMNKTFDVSVHKAAAIARIQAEFDELDHAAKERFADLSLSDMAARLPDALGDHFHQAGAFVHEIPYRRCAVIRRPWDVDAGFRLARCLARVEANSPEAIEICMRLLQISPGHERTRRLLAELEDAAAR